MLKQLTLTIDTSDPLQARWLAEYQASPDRVRFGRACLLLGFLAATGQVPVDAQAGREGSAAADSPAAAAAEGRGTAPPQRGVRIGAGLFGLE